MKAFLAVTIFVFSLVPSSVVRAATPTCLGSPATTIGTTGPDTINGTSGPDVIVGNGGNDTISGAGGQDVICGSDGNDVIWGGAGADRLSGGIGGDLLYGGADADSSQGDAGVDTCDSETATCEATAGQDLTEANAGSWTSFSTDSTTTSVADTSTKTRVGRSSLKFTTSSNNLSGVTFPASGSAHLDLSSDNYLTFWAFMSGTGFRGTQPRIILSSPSGRYEYDGATPMILPGMWHQFHVPLSGSSFWSRFKFGTPTLTNVTKVQIEQLTSTGSGFSRTDSVYYDGVRFADLTPPSPPSGPPPPAGVDPDEISPKVLLYIYDPILENMGGQRLHQVYGWTDPVTLTDGIVSDLTKSSHGLVNYDIVQTKVVDAYPYFKDGFQYDDASFESDWGNRTPHDSGFDYRRFIRDDNITSQIDSGKIDEVWIYAFPYAGLWESTMAGTGAYYCNSNPVSGVASKRAFVIMGWNYERGVAEAIHSYGHRTESIMNHDYGSAESGVSSDSWDRFITTDIGAPGNGGVGTVHIPVNGQSDYDYANPRYVQSNADDWYNYPNFKGVSRSINDSEWTGDGSDPQRGYLDWWYDHIPHFSGEGADHYLNNWWRYIADPDQFKSWNGNLLWAHGQPNVSITAPAQGAKVSGHVNVTATATELQDGAVGRVDLYMDGSYLTSDTLAPYTFDWSTLGLSIGQHSLVAKAYDLQNGTEGVSNTVTVNVSN